jgi:hypothetical protein
MKMMEEWKVEMDKYNFRMISRIKSKYLRRIKSLLKMKIDRITIMFGMITKLEIRW